VASETPENVIAIDEALRSLAAADERKARVVELRFFVGMSVQETAHVREISQKRVMRDWRFAKNWLMRELSRQGTAGTR
jgi:RNA polymerase sigma-70 factor (ECF subfamily)